MDSVAGGSRAGCARNTHLPSLRKELARSLRAHDTLDAEQDKDHGLDDAPAIRSPTSDAPRPRSDALSSITLQDGCALAIVCRTSRSLLSRWPTCTDALSTQIPLTSSITNGNR